MNTNINTSRALLFFTLLIIALTIGVNICQAQSNKQNSSSLRLKIEFVNNPPLQLDSLKNRKKTLIVRIKLINQLDQDIYVESLIYNATITFNVENALNKSVQDKYIIEEPQINKSYLVKLKALGEYTLDIDLLANDEYKIKENKNYFLSATYNSEQSEYFNGDKTKLFTGKLKSNILIIKQ